MGRPRENVVRFAVGGPNRPWSTVWRLWTGKGTSDVYISARTLGGALKVSLHESGTWRFRCCNKGPTTVRYPSGWYEPRSVSLRIDAGRLEAIRVGGTVLVFAETLAGSSSDA